MIEKIEMFNIKCDICGKMFEDQQQGFCACNCENGDRNIASKSDWHKEDIDTHYWPGGYSFDDFINDLKIK